MWKVQRQMVDFLIQFIIHNAYSTDITFKSPDNIASHCIEKNNADASQILLLLY
jgi:hypothetical protein